MKKLCFLLFALLATLGVSASKVYFDNSDTNWAKVNAYVWGGSVTGQAGWPGNEMTLNSTTNLWEIEFNGTPANIIFNNGSGNQTGDLIFEDGATYNKDGVVGAEIPVYKAYFDNSTAQWDKIYAYYWEGASSGDWPGVQLTTSVGDIWEVAIKSALPPGKIIFNNNSGNQTPNLVFEDGATYNEGGKVGAEPDPDAWKNWWVNFKGDFNSWSSDEGVQADADGIATSRTYTAQGGFKVCVWNGSSDVWHSSGAEVAVNEWISIPDNGDNMTFPADVIGNEVVFKFDVINNKLMVVYEEPVKAPETLFVYSNMTGFTPIEMTKTETGFIAEGVVIPTQEISDMSGYFKFTTVAEPQSMDHYYGAQKSFQWTAADTEYPIIPGSSSNWEIFPGTYDFIVTVAADASMTFKYVKQSVPVVEMITIYWDNAAGWEGLSCSPMDELFHELTDDPIYMMPVFEPEDAAEYTGKVSPENLYVAQIPANTVLMYIANEDFTQMWMNFDTEDFSVTAPVADQMVYGQNGAIGLITEVIKVKEPEPAGNYIFKWYNPEGLADYTAEAGTAVAKGDEARVNYPNTALGVAYRTICLSGKKADLEKGTPYVEVTFAEPLKEGDVISMTAYRNKNSNAGANAYLLFNNNASVVIGGSNGLGFVNLNADGDTPEATEPNTLTYTVTAAEAGATSMTMVRDKSGTNLFITELTISRESEPEPDPVPEALYLRGNVDAENNMLVKDGIVYSGTVTVKADAGSMYGVVRVYTANEATAKNYGGVTESVNCVAVSGKIIELAEDGVDISVLPGNYNVQVEWADDIKTIVFTKVEAEGLTIYWDNTVANWAEPWIGWMTEDGNQDMIDMTRNAAASPEGYSLWSSKVPANTVLIQIWDMADEIGDNIMEPSEDIVDNGVYGPTGYVCKLDELGKTEPEPAPEALYLRGNVDPENNMLAKDGIVYSGTVTVKAEPGSMYGTVRVYTANEATAKNYGGVTESVNCVAVSGKIIELAEDGVDISVAPGDYNVKVEWAEDIKSIVFTKAEAEGLTIYWDNTVANWGEPWIGWLTDERNQDIAAMTRDAAASPEGYSLWSAKVPANSIVIQIMDMADEEGENYTEQIEDIVDNGVYGPEGYICLLDELGKTEPEPEPVKVFIDGSNTDPNKGNIRHGIVGTQAEGFTIQITGNTEKTLDNSNKFTINGTSYTGMKNSNGQQTTVTLPEGYVGKSVTIYSTINHDTDNSYWNEVDGIEYDGSEQTHATHKGSGENYDTNTFPLSGKNTFTFNNKGKQLIFVLEVEMVPATVVEPGFVVPETLYLLGLSDAIEMTRNGNTFTAENVDVPSWFGMCPAMFFQDVPTEGAADARRFAPKVEDTEEGVAICTPGVAFDLVEVTGVNEETSFTTPFAARYNFSVTFEDGKITATVTEVEPEKIVVYWDNTVAQWAKPGVVVDIYYLWGTGKAPIEMTPVEGRANLFMAEIPDNLQLTIFMDLSQDPESEDFDPEASVYEYEDGAPVANMVYSNYKAPVDISNWSAIVNIEAESADAVYFDLRGVRVEKPAAGNLYIRVEDGKASKVRF